MSEGEPQGYQFKHHKQVYLDDYRGVAGEIMEMNDPITDGFMQTADMRGDIVIIQKPHDRVMDYDQIGTVRVAKFLELPRFDMWHRDKKVHTKKEDDTWYLAVDDQQVAQEVSHTGNGEGGFNERYVNAFQQEVSKGMKSILKKEKLLNAGDYSRAFIVSYYAFLTKDLLVLPFIEMNVLLNSTNIEQVAQGTARVAALSIGINTVFNAGNLISVGAGKLNEKITGKKMEQRKYPSYEEPFIRHSLPEYIMPSVPIDRLVRGNNYLKTHGQELINLVK